MSDRNLKRISLSILFALLVPMAGMTGFVSIGTQPVQAAGEVIDTFEDGDMQGWTPNSDASFTATSSVAYEGDYSATDTSDNTYAYTEKQVSNAGPESVGFAYRADGTDRYGGKVGMSQGDDYWAFQLGFSGGTTLMADDTSTGISIPANTWVYIKILNIDYSSGTYDIEVTFPDDSTQTYTGATFNNAASASNVDGFRIAHGNSMKMWYDSIETDVGTSLVSGTVTDEEGNAISGATVTTDTGKSTTTSSDGSYSFELADGSYTLDYTADGYTSNSNSITVSGSDLTGVDATLGYPLKGQVLDESGDPVPNASVQITGVDYNNITPDASQTLKERANELLQEASHPLPDSFDRSMDVNLQYISEREKNVPLMYTTEDMGAAPWVDSANLKSPRVVLPADKELAVVGWDPETESGRFQGEYDSQLPGKSLNEGTVVAKQLGPDGSVVSTTDIPLDDANGGGYLDPDSLTYGEVDLPRGIYKITMKGSDWGYPIAIGQPDNIASAIEKDLETEAGSLTDRAKSIQDKFTDGRFKSVNVTTDQNGYYNASVGSQVDTVGVAAYSASDVDLTSVDPIAYGKSQDVHPRELMRTMTAAGDLNGTIYIPGAPEHYQVPNSNADVTVKEVETSPYTNPAVFQNRSEWLDDLFNNESFVDNFRSNLGLNDTDTDQLHEDLTELREENDNLQDKYDSLRQEYLNSDQSGDTEVVLNQTTNQTEIRLMRQAIQSLQGSLQPDDSGTDTTYENGTVSATIPWNGDLDPDAVSVTAHFPSTESSRPVPDEYISVNKRLGQGDVLEITDYPVNENSPMVSFSATVSGEDGEDIGNKKLPVRNPAWTGQQLSVDSVSVSTLRPGPDEKVTITPSAANDMGTISEVNATVQGPSGSVPVTQVDSDTVSFRTDGSGNYDVNLRLTDSNGQAWSEALSLKANSETVIPPAGVRAIDGFTGQFAMVGDGIESGSMDTDGNQLTMTGVAPSDDIPSEVHFYASEISNNHDKTTLQLMKSNGDNSPETIQKHSKVYYHTADLPEDSIIYREGNEPLKFGDSTEYGTVRCPSDSDGCVIETYTDAQGTVDLTVNTNPDMIDRAIHWVRTTSPFKIPIIALIPTPSLLGDLLDGLVSSPPLAINPPGQTSVVGGVLA